jgi:hypothetical protein
MSNGQAAPFVGSDFAGMDPKADLPLWQVWKVGAPETILEVRAHTWFEARQFGIIALSGDYSTVEAEVCAE